MRKNFFVLACAVWLCWLGVSYAQDSTTVVLGGVFSWVGPIMEGMLGKYGWASAVFMWIGVLRFTMKPVFETWHYVVALTPSTKDDDVLKKVEDSKAMKTVLFVLNWLASIKLKKA